MGSHGYAKIGKNLDGISAYSVKPGFERAASLENSVFLHLRRKHSNICYYKTEHQKKEIDFVVTTSRGDLLLYQACAEMSDAGTRKREISAILAACQEFDLKEAIIVTEDHEEEIEVQGILIHCIPFWKWASEQPG